MSNLTFKKDGIELNVKTIADSVKYNQDSTVKQALDNIITRLNSIDPGGSTSPDIGTSTPIDTTHNTLSINSEQGAHDLRYYNDKLSININGEWIDLNLGGTKIEGIKLPPTKFIEIHSRESTSTNVTIMWEDGGDQVLNGAIISKWVGTKLIRKLDSPPTNEHDGELLLDNKDLNKYKINGYVDTNIQLDTAYYYALFPYSDDGTHNFDITNIRKFYKTEGAIPGNTTNISVVPIFNAIKLFFTDGESTSTALWAGTRVVRKIGSQPTSETDGVIVLDNSSRNKHQSNGFTDDTATQKVDYYYGFFPYSSEGHFNLDPDNIVMGNPVTRKMYGMRIDMTNNSPSEAVTYTNSAVDITPDTGWDSIDLFANIKPCLFKNGKVNYYLNPNDYTKKLDGSPSNLNGLDGDVMIEIPYIGVYYSANGNYLDIHVCDDYELSRSNLGYSSHTHMDKDGNIAKKIYVGAFQGYIDSNNLYSKTGVVPTKYTIKQIEDAVKSRGDYYCPYTGSINLLLATLYMLKYKTRLFSDHLATNNNIFAGETGTLNKSGLWHKGNTGKIAGIEWGVINAMIWLSNYLVDNNWYVNSTQYNRSTRSLKVCKPMTNQVVSSMSYSIYYPNYSAWNKEYQVDGYTQKMRGLGNNMLPGYNNSGSSSTGWGSYVSGMTAYNQTYNATQFIFINLNINGAYKNMLNYHTDSALTESIKSNTSYTYATYLMYIKAGED